MKNDQELNDELQERLAASARSVIASRQSLNKLLTLAGEPILPPHPCEFLPQHYERKPDRLQQFPNCARLPRWLFRLVSFWQRGICFYVWRMRFSVRLDLSLK